MQKQFITIVKCFMVIVALSFTCSCKKEHLQPNVPTGGTTEPFVYTTFQINISTTCIDAHCQNVTVVNQQQQGCSASFIATIIAGTNQVQFTSASTGTNANTTYSWSFGDNTPGSTLQNPNHIYSQTGTYNVCLITNTPTNGVVCTDTLCRNITVGQQQACSANFAANVISGTTQVQFTNTSTGTNANTVYLWNFGDNTTSNLQNPTHTYNQINTYNVCLTITSQINIAADSIYLAGGVNSYAGSTSVFDTLTYRKFNFTLKNPQHPSQSYFKISINNYQSVLGNPQSDLNSSIYQGDRNYQFGANFTPLNATIDWIDSAGIKYSSDAVQQNNIFSITAVEDVAFDNKNYKKTTVQFDCFLSDANGSVLHLTNGKATILFSIN